MDNKLPYGKNSFDSILSYQDAVFLGVLESDPKGATLHVYRIGPKKAIVDERTGEITQKAPYFQKERSVGSKEVSFKEMRIRK